MNPATSHSARYHIDDITQLEANNSHQLILTFLEPKGPVLDVGCSTGFLGKHLHALQRQVVGIEVDPAAAVQARPYYDKVIVGDVQSAEVLGQVADAHFSSVVLGDVIEHLTDPWSFIRAIARKAVPGGSLIVSIPNLGHSSVIASLLSGDFQYREMGLLDRTHFRFFSLRSLCALALEAGLTPVELKRVRHDTFNTEIPVSVDRLPAGLIPILDRCAESHTYQFVLKAVNAPPVESLSYYVDRFSQARTMPAGDEAHLANYLQQLETCRREVRGLRQQVADQQSLVTEARATLEQERQARRDAEHLLATSGWDLREKAAAEIKTSSELRLKEIRAELAERRAPSEEPLVCDTPYDIVIPIYNAFDHVKKCVQSVLRHTPSIHQVYLLDDASTDERMMPLLKSFADADPRVRVLPSPKNAGFVKNTNRGFKLSRNNVVILNSDTEVTPLWMERMHRCRLSSPGIGIVCPLSNNATILSVPVMNAPNPLPAGLDPESFSRLVAECSIRAYRRLPTAVGFCMLITRQVLDKVGSFEEAFGLGYGEENDFCERARQLGFEIVACDDAYVHHYGEASFGAVPQIDERRRRNQQLLNERWPQYHANILHFCRANPLRDVQERIYRAIEQLRGLRQHEILHVIHNFNASAGTELHTRNVIDGLADRIRSTVIYPVSQPNLWSDMSSEAASRHLRVVKLVKENTAAKEHFIGFGGDLNSKIVEENFARFISGGDYGIVHFQHFADWSSLYLPLIAKSLGKKVVLSLHDYYLLCPEYNLLLPGSQRRCGKPMADGNDPECLYCLGTKRVSLSPKDPPTLNSYLAQRRELTRQIVAAADALVAPSIFVKQAFLRAYGPDLDSKLVVIPHGVDPLARSPRPTRSSRLRVAFLGNATDRKGILVFLRAVQLLQNSPVSFEIFGGVPRGLEATFRQLGIVVHGSYHRKDLPRLLSKTDLVAVTSVWDETYCLTLSEAQFMSIPVIASDAGALSERIEEGRTGFLVPAGNADALASRLLALAKDPRSLEPVLAGLSARKHRTIQENVEDYARLYKDLLGTSSFELVPEGKAGSSTSCAIVSENAGAKVPDASIIVLVHNQLEHTRQCLASIAHHTPQPHELIVVDNGSSDDTPSFLQQWQATHSNCIVIRNDANRGFAAGNNQALSLVRGEAVLLLNNDTVVTEGWLEAMLRVLRQHPETGIVGPMSNNVSGPQQVQHAQYKDLSAMPAFAAQWRTHHQGESVEANRVVGFCLLLRRSILERVGGLDEQFGSGNFEDDDLCIRSRLAGFGVRIAQDVFIHHTGSQTFKGARIDYRQAMLRNWDLFRRKWQLSPESSLEGGYHFPKYLPAGFELKIALPNLSLSHRQAGEKRWMETTPASNPGAVAPAEAKISAVASLGSLDEARILFQKGELATAWNSGVQALITRPFHPKAALLLAEVALAAGDGQSARRCAQFARGLTPEWKTPKQFLQKSPKGKERPAWLKLPDCIGAQAKQNTQTRARLTVCVITRNEERFLAQCLESVKNLANQIVVVDTGSTDRTVDIAKSFGAEVFHFAWCDDFAAARNAALEHARGDWVLILDADEELPSDQHARLIADLKNNEAIALRLPLVNRGQEAEGRSYVPRLFRNAPGAYYLGRIHEQVFPSLIAIGKPLGLCTGLGTAQILHHGYSQETVRDRNKIERNLKLLRLAVQESPDDVNLAMNLGLELVRSDELSAGLVQYRRAFQLMANKPIEDTAPELREALLTQFTSHLYKTRAHDEVVEVLDSPIARKGTSASLHFALGLACYELGRYPQAVEQMRQCLAKRQQPALSPINTDILTAAPYHCLAMSLAKSGDAIAAEKAFQSGLNEKGRLEELRLDYARFLVQQNRHVDALHRLHELVIEQAHSAAAWCLGAQIALSRPDFLEVACDWTAEAVNQLPDDTEIAAQRAEALLLSQQVEPARKLWRTLWQKRPQPRSQAALILCELVQDGNLSGLEPNEAELGPTNRALIDWYQRCLTMRAQNVLDLLNQRLDRLSALLPAAAGMIEAAVADARAESNIPEPCLA